MSILKLIFEHPIATFLILLLIGIIGEAWIKAFRRMPDDDDDDDN